jgi:hypothetical protein
VPLFDLKFLHHAQQSFQELQIEKPHWNHKLASAPLLPRFVSESAARITNFGRGALALRSWSGQSLRLSNRWNSANIGGCGAARAGLRRWAAEYPPILPSFRVS